MHRKNSRGERASDWTNSRRFWKYQEFIYCWKTDKEIVDIVLLKESEEELEEINEEIEPKQKWQVRIQINH